MKKLLPKQSNQIGLGILLIGLLFPSAANAQFIRQEFQGNFDLLSVSPFLEDSTPEETNYSGFITYDQQGMLRDWEINVDELSLILDPNSSLSGGLGLDLFPTVSFDFSDEASWSLSVDFGLAFDAPLYQLDRDNSDITFVGSLGLAGGYTYQDSSPTIDVSPVPEPLTILGAGTAMLFGVSFKGKVKKSKKK